MLDQTSKRQVMCETKFIKTSILWDQVSKDNLFVRQELKQIHCDKVLRQVKYDKVLRQVKYDKVLRQVKYDKVLRQVKYDKVLRQVICLTQWNGTLYQIEINIIHRVY